MAKVSVDGAALREVLQALNGPGHLVRELQALRGSPVVGPNCIDRLVDEFNAQVSAPRVLTQRVMIDVAGESRDNDSPPRLRVLDRGGAERALEIATHDRVVSVVLDEVDAELLVGLVRRCVIAAPGASPAQSNAAPAAFPVRVVGSTLGEPYQRVVCLRLEQDEMARDQVQLSAESARALIRVLEPSPKPTLAPAMNPQERLG